MNKFIKTKDTIYLKLYDLDNDKNCVVVGKTPIDFGTYLHKSNIVKEADTIEELCDGFYIANEDEFLFDKDEIYYDFEDFACCLIVEKYHDKFNVNGYGFIQTTKGLIYVAKLNDKGELVLI